MPTAEDLTELPAPFAGAARIARCNKSERREPIAILLAFGQKDDLRRIGRNQLRKPIQHLAGASRFPLPTAPGFRPTLDKVLWPLPDHLVKQLAPLVAVIVGGDNLRPAVAVV
ncbi:MAG: hypothetical protein ACYTG0_37670 [Planctomycetota bacterium]